MATAGPSQAAPLALKVSGALSGCILVSSLAATVGEARQEAARLLGKCDSVRLPSLHRSSYLAACARSQLCCLCCTDVEDPKIIKIICSGRILQVRGPLPSRPDNTLMAWLMLMATDSITNGLNIKLCWSACHTKVCSWCHACRTWHCHPHAHPAAASADLPSILFTSRTSVLMRPQHGLYLRSSHWHQRAAGTPLPTPCPHDPPPPLAPPQDDSKALSAERVNERSRLLVTKGAAAGAALTAQQQQAERLQQLRTAADKLASRDGRGTTNRYELVLENQDGNALNFSESDRKALIMGLSLHAKGGNSMRAERFKPALDELLLAEEAFSLADPKLLQVGWTGGTDVAGCSSSLLWCCHAEAAAGEVYRVPGVIRFGHSLLLRLWWQLMLPAAMPSAARPLARRRGTVQQACRPLQPVPQARISHDSVVVPHVALRRARSPCLHLPSALTQHACLACRASTTTPCCCWTSSGAATSCRTRAGWPPARSGCARPAQACRWAAGRGCAVVRQQA